MAPPVTAPISSDMGQARCPRSEWQHRKKSRFALLSTSEVTSQNVCDGVRVLRTLLSCFEAHSGKSGTLLHVVTHVAPSVPRGINHRKQASAARRREPPAEARLVQTPPPPDVRCRVPYRNRSDHWHACGVRCRAALVITLFVWWSSAALLGEQGVCLGRRRFLTLSLRSNAGRALRPCGQRTASRRASLPWGNPM